MVETKSPCPIHRSSSKLMINETLKSNPGVKTISFVIARLGRLFYLKGDEGIKTPPINVSYFPFIPLTFPFVSVFFPRTTTYFFHIRRECWIQETKYYSRYKNTKPWKKKKDKSGNWTQQKNREKRKEENSLTILLKIMTVKIWQKQWKRISSAEVKMAVYAELVQLVNRAASYRSL